MGKAMNESVRVRTAGAAHARNERRVMLGAVAFAGIGCVVALAALLWPLPSPDGVEIASPELTLGGVNAGDELGVREQRLGLLAAAGNVFATDRAAWVDEQAVQTAEAEPEPVPEPETVVVTNTPGDELVPIILTERPTAAAKKSRDALVLRGIFASGDRRLAMIQGGESDRRKDVELYREGDEFFAGTWLLRRIEPANDRVILEHLSHGDVLELTLYDVSIPRLAEAPPMTLEIARATETQARNDLRDAGVDAAEVDRVFEVLAALERGEEPPAIDEEVPTGAEGAVAATLEPARERKPGEAPAMPPGMAELLRSMAADAARSRGGDEPDSEN